MMTGRERDALAALRFNYAKVPDDVWRPLPFHVGALHQQTAKAILDGFIEAEESADASPIGLVIQGQRGVGKTHLLGWARQAVHEEDGYFFLVGLLDARSFWESVLLSMLDSLSRPMPGAGTQLKELLWRLCLLTEVPPDARQSVIGEASLSRQDLDVFVRALRRYDRHVGRDAQDVARALVLRASSDLSAQDVGDAYLACAVEGEPGERAGWGFTTIGKSPQEIVSDISHLVALTGPSVVAIDQIDVMLAQSSMTLADDRKESWQQALALERVAGGLLMLREVTRRTLTVLSCLPATWDLIQTKATDTVQDRFRETSPLGTIPDAETGRKLIEKRFAAQYARVGFAPPHPTWPVRPEAFGEAHQYTPRQLLIRIDTHVRACLASGQVTELARLTDKTPVTVCPVIDLPDDLTGLDRRFAELRERADVAGALDPVTEDAVMPWLLSAGLKAWIAEQGETGRLFSQDPPPSSKPPLHARLRRTLDEATENEAHWCFRAIAATHHVAALTRLKNASMAAGLNDQIPRRKLFVLRNQSWANGPATQEALAAFEQAGGRVLQVEEDDLRIFAALRNLLADNPPDLQAWLVSRRPTSEVKLFAEALSDAAVPRVSDAGVRTSSRATRSPDQPRPTANPGQRVLVERAVVPQPVSQPVPSPASGAAPAKGGTDNALPGDAGIGPAGSDLRFAPPPSFAGAPPAETPSVEVPVPSAEVPSAEPMPAEELAGEIPAVPRPRRPLSPGEALTPGEALSSSEALTAPHLTIGAASSDDRPVRIALDALRKHVAIFAGSGSGKTVLIRRLVEECALRGVSSVVLDPNNDLARLGDPWPEPPGEWGEGDADRAADYLAGTDVVVWTPRKEQGRPLSFQPLPDFASVADDPDEFGEAVDAALAALVPRAKVDGRPARAHLGRAVLREAVVHYGRHGGTALNGLVALLDDLPDGVSRLEGAARLATEMAQHLRAEMISDPLFAGKGVPVDPEVLLTPAAGKRARVSVISLTGLTSDAQRQSFVNQLQMALFSWIKRHPAGDQPLGGLFVMDEAQTFAPSGATTACTQSTLALAAQARKYGLGLVFATQAPKSLHNRITGNAATQFFGLLNAPAQITAARELARAKGGDVPDVARLRSGQFYAAVEGGSFTKVRTPLCLSHHPSNPLTSEEVVARARG
ncbi:helicase HerA domain-containing protein [Microbispora sp. NBC_01389]|uniref:helicase HerA domain-containing protein n=1 Tax=Microbispora sp. NBC_01389 TaxID=2903584 RepID=UPI00324859BA